MTDYTLQPIPGKTLSRRLPEGTALVLEGGGLRGYYSCGVMEAFMEKDLLFPYIIGVSAGAANALSYISGQPGRSREIIEHYVGNPDYVSTRNLLKKHNFFDWDKFHEQDTRFLTGAMNCADGKTVWFEKDTLKAPFMASRASCSVPLITKIQHYMGYDLLDGGISDPIPIEKSLADGNTFHVIVLTRNKGYQKEPFGHTAFLKAAFRKHPAVAEAMRTRHEIYNRQLALCEKLEKAGRAVIIRPLKPLNVSRTKAEVPALLALHDEGLYEGRAALGSFEEMLNIKL